MAKVIVYIDGYNLYYRCAPKAGAQMARHTARLAENRLFPDDNVIRIKYFTASSHPA